MDGLESNGEQMDRRIKNLEEKEETSGLDVVDEMFRRGRAKHNLILHGVVEATKVQADLQEQDKEAANNILIHILD